MIRIEKLNKTYDRRSIHKNHVLHDVTFTLPDTGFICILGPSGCGKTSLLNAIGGLDSFDNGTISGDGFSIKRYGTRRFEAERNRSFGYIFQNYYLLSEHSVAYNVYIGLHSLDLSHKEKLIRVKEALEAVDMQRYEKRMVKDLSGGQQQRVAIARALARRPRVIFADEPTGNLDEINTMNICTLLRRISKTSLVVMVTHEEHIANFFADRIIKLDRGVISSDSDFWQRGSLSVTDGVYSSDYQDKTTECEGVTLRVLREEGAANAEISVILGRDRIIIKLDDKRAVSTVGVNESPLIIEGTRPELTLDELDREGENDLIGKKWSERDKAVKAGKGMGLSMIFAEARRGMRKKGSRNAGMIIFLLILTVLTVIMVSDYITVSSVDPEEFITTDSHILNISIERDAGLGVHELTLNAVSEEYRKHLDESGLNFKYLPRVSNTASITAKGFLQLGSVSAKLVDFSYIPIEYLDPDTIIYGRMPESPDEVVIDRWVLDNFMKKDGIVQRGIVDASSFLGVSINYKPADYSPEIVGICDSGEPSLYLSQSALITLGVTGHAAVTLSELQKMYPGEYDSLSLTDEECYIVSNVAGSVYSSQIGTTYTTRGNLDFIIKDAINVPGAYAFMIVSDNVIDEFLRSTVVSNFNIYCENKEAMTMYIKKGLPDNLNGKILVFSTDEHSDKLAEYTEASTMRADARTIVTVTVIAISMVMLYLTQRSRIQGRMETIAVYRLLGIPKRKLLSIFSFETVILSLKSSLPAAALTYTVITVLARISDLNFTMKLPLQAAAATYLGILIFHLFVSLFPVARLLSLPPSRLASKYDI